MSVRPPTADEHHRLAAARVIASRRLPYLSTALFAMVPCIDSVGTAAVDQHWRLYLDPDALNSWTANELAGVLVHEVSHLLRRHFRRAQAIGVNASSRLRWNIATDCAINDDILAAGIELPAGVVTAHSLGLPDHRVEEEYFDLLRPDDTQSNGACPSEGSPVEHGSGVDGLRRPWDLPAPGDEHGPEHPGRTQTDIAHISRTVRREIAEHQRQHGARSVPGGLSRWANAKDDPVVPWPTLLRAVLRQSTRHSAGGEANTWRRPSRRQAASPGILFPGRHQHELHIAAIVDTSASMDQTLINQALTEVEWFRRRSNATVRLISCDAEAHDHGRLTRRGPIELVGGGGTSLDVGITMAAQRPSPDLIVVLTDGYTPWPASLPPIPVVAVLFGNDAPTPTNKRMIVVRTRR